jgi:phospholipid-translocating ATPase
MLTGDKVETATCIAISAGFKDRRQQIFYMRDIESVREAELKLNDFEQKTNTLLMIDGQTLDLFLSRFQLEERFFKAATLAPAVCVCRCSPTQKATITVKIG